MDLRKCLRSYSKSCEDSSVSCQGLVWASLWAELRIRRNFNGQWEVFLLGLIEMFVDEWLLLCENVVIEDLPVLLY